jgi:hypothetical protein
MIGDSAFPLKSVKNETEGFCVVVSHREYLDVTVPLVQKNCWVPTCTARVNLKPMKEKKHERGFRCAMSNVRPQMPDCRCKTRSVAIDAHNARTRTQASCLQLKITSLVSLCNNTFCWWRRSVGLAKLSWNSPK